MIEAFSRPRNLRTRRTAMAAAALAPLMLAISACGGGSSVPTVDSPASALGQECSAAGHERAEGETTLYCTPDDAGALAWATQTEYRNHELALRTQEAEEKAEKEEAALKAAEERAAAAEQARVKAEEQEKANEAAKAAEAREAAEAQAAERAAAAQKQAADQAAAAEKKAADQIAANKAKAAQQAPKKLDTIKQAPAPAQKSQPRTFADTGAPKYFKNCTAARQAGAAPVRAGDPGYGRHLDRDGDGVGCE